MNILAWAIINHKPTTLHSEKRCRYCMVTCCSRCNSKLEKVQKSASLLTIHLFFYSFHFVESSNRRALTYYTNSDNTLRTTCSCESNYWRLVSTESILITVHSFSSALLHLSLLSKQTEMGLMQPTPAPDTHKTGLGYERLLLSSSTTAEGIPSSVT